MCSRFAEIVVWRGALVEATDVSRLGVESRADLKAAASAAGVAMPSDHQLGRWRYHGLLPPVRQIIPNPYDGSAVEFPNGTSRQIVEIQRLMKINKKFEYVGWQLWWAGFWTDEKYWKPRLEHSAKIGDRALKLLKVLMWKEDKRGGENAVHSDTTFDQKIELPVTNTIFSRMKPRIRENQIGQLLRILIEMETGRFEHFDDPNDMSDNSDQAVVIRALDIQDMNSYDAVPDRDDPSKGKHTIFGQQLDLTKEVPFIFAGVSRALKQGKLSNVLHFPQQEIEQARDDVRNAMRMAVDLYEATNWLFGKRALGLRFLAWIGRHATPAQNSISVLGFALMRRVGNVLLPSSEIASNAAQASELRGQSAKLQKIAASDPVLKNLLSPKALKFAISDRGQYQLFLNRIKKARTGGITGNSTQE